MIIPLRNLQPHMAYEASFILTPPRMVKTLSEEKPMQSSNAAFQDLFYYFLEQQEKKKEEEISNPSVVGSIYLSLFLSVRSLTPFFIK